jgi:antitoxin HigA-1
METKMLHGRKRRPTHPGAMLREIVLPEIGMNQGEFAAWLGVSCHATGRRHLGCP